MGAADVANRLLGYLKEQGSENTFKLASMLEIDRYKLLDIIKKLEDKGAVEVKFGTVRFLKFPEEGKKPIKAEKISPKLKIKKTSPKSKKKVKKAIEPPLKKRVVYKKKVAIKKSRAFKALQAEHKQLGERFLELEAGTKRQLNLKNQKIGEQDKQIENLEKTIKELQRKANVPPKIITRTVIKKVNVPPKIIRKTIVKKVLVKAKKPLKKENEYVTKLKMTIKELHKRLSTPKVTKITKKVPITGKKKSKISKIKLLHKHFHKHVHTHLKKLNVPKMFK